MDPSFSALKKNYSAEGKNSNSTSNPGLNVKNNVKTAVKTNFLLHELLQLLAKEMYGTEIAKKFGWSRQKLHYYISKLKKLGLIHEKVRSSMILYELTPECKSFITGCNKFYNGAIRLHNISYSLEILQDADMPHDKEISVLGYWNKQIKRLSDATIEKTTKHIIIHIKSLVGSDPYELINKSRTTVEELRIILEKSFKFKLGDPMLIRKPHFAVMDPLANKIVKHIQVSTEEAKLDASEGLGELEFFDPVSVDNYIKMPQKIAELENHLIKQTEIMDQFSKNLELHLQVLQEIRDAVKEMKKI